MRLQDVSERPGIADRTGSCPLRASLQPVRRDHDTKARNEDTAMTALYGLLYEGGFVVRSHRNFPQFFSFERHRCRSPATFRGR